MIIISTSKRFEKYKEAFAGTTLEGGQGMNVEDDWIWLVRPTGPAEFDEMMVSVNRHLAVQNLKVHQRALHASRLVSIALGFSGVSIFGASIDHGDPFSPADTLQRVFEWYRENYGERNKVDYSPGAVVMNLHSTYWRLKIPFVRGTIPLFIDRDLSIGNVEGVFRGPAPPRNVLLQVENLTQAYAMRLTDDELSYIWSEFHRGWNAVSCLTNLRGHELFNQAQGDYAQSVETLLDGRTLSKARWDTAQCAEKIFKGLLALAGYGFPKSGGKGHDIAHLGELMKQHFGLEISRGSLAAIHCPPMVRYGEMNVDPNEAWTSHMALLSVLRSISAAPIGSTSVNWDRPIVIVVLKFLRHVWTRLRNYLRLSKFLNFLSICSFLAGAFYAISMLVYPWFVSPISWKHVQLVWDHWQGLNVGMLAFLSSVIAFNISRYNAEQQRAREFLAAKAFLPQAFSELSEYFKASASVLARAWDRQRNENVEIDPPQLPSDYREIFEKCIRHAAPEVGEYLVDILVWMQVHSARLREFFRGDDGVIRINLDHPNLITYLYRLGQLQALINKNFDFARNLHPFESSPLDWEDFRNAFGTLNIWYHQYEYQYGDDDRTTLEDFTKRTIERNNPN